MGHVDADVRSDHPPQVERVARREDLPVVVEVRVDVDRRAPLGDPRRPLAKLGLRVVAAPPAMAVVEAHEREVGHDLVRLELRDLRAIADRQRHAVPAQQLVDVVAEPRRMTELERVAPRR